MTIETQVATELVDLLDIDMKTARKCVRAIFSTITTALHNEEKVYLRGFGTFKVVTRTPNRTGNNFLTSTEFASHYIDYPPRKYVIFEPALPMMALLNIDTPNYKERRTAARWQSGSDHDHKQF